MTMNEKLASALAAFCSVALIWTRLRTSAASISGVRISRRSSSEGEGVALEGGIEGAGGEVDEQNSNQPAHLLMLRPSTRGRARPMAGSLVRFGGWSGPRRGD